MASRNSKPGIYRCGPSFWPLDPRLIRAYTLYKVGNEQMTTVEKLYQEAIALPPEDLQRLIEMLSEAESVRPEMTEEEFQMRLMSEGIISELPRPLAEREEEGFRPIQVQGKPLSETIIEERR